ncbi:separin [Pseudozyma hubeiensis SY62]|uniref:Separin n=1 Tax=Pseudozyma hubeiensis (strain SY62) TaxID=1305764 RepID=R9PCF7_PSEHS|nr:separin [Pseudozyma hubeiensis SY62]GAC95755.1 separin [Pseudozyma hubeiensis SY62]
MCTYGETKELTSLSSSVGSMTSEEKVVPGLHPPCESHEDGRVGAECTGHGSRDHLFILAEIGDCCEWKSPVGYWSPEMCRLREKKKKV